MGKNLILEVFKSPF